MKRMIPTLLWILAGGPAIGVLFCGHGFGVEIGEFIQQIDPDGVGFLVGMGLGGLAWYGFGKWFHEIYKNWGSK